MCIDRLKLARSWLCVYEAKAGELLASKEDLGREESVALMTAASVKFVCFVCDAVQND